MSQFPVGHTVRRTATVTEQMIDEFARLSGDTSRLHMDRDFAIARGFRGRVAHGTLLGALISGLIGTELPGDAGVLHELKLAFHQPCCAGDDIALQSTVIDAHDTLQVLTCEVVISLASGDTLVKGRYRSGLLASP